MADILHSWETDAQGRMRHIDCPKSPPGEVLWFPKDDEYLCECGSTTDPERYEDDEY